MNVLNLLGPNFRKRLSLQNNARDTLLTFLGGAGWGMGTEIKINALKGCFSKFERRSDLMTVHMCHFLERGKLVFV